MTILDAIGSDSQGSSRSDKSVENVDDMEDELQDCSDFRPFFLASSHSQPTQHGESPYSDTIQQHSDQTIVPPLQAFDATMLHAISLQRRTPRSKLCAATWIEASDIPNPTEPSYRFSHAQVSTIKGIHFKSIGRTISSKKTILLPEETLYLIDQGVLELLLGGGCVTLQHAYALLIGNAAHQIPLIAYQTYAYLKRLGFHVFRSNNVTKAKVLRYSHVNTPKQSHDQLGDRTGRCILWHVYKPHSNFKKSNRRPPDFAVVGVHAHDPFPTISQISGMMADANTSTSEIKVAIVDSSNIGFQSISML
ncbi:hypothetical protein BASA83_005395 [Batrachochytrium salamandrivorans]|nr:hypothetical protein BASA83_005395 [Batrachochytrium salamandrivorans]